MYKMIGRGLGGTVLLLLALISAGGAFAGASAVGSANVNAGLILGAVVGSVGFAFLLSSIGVFSGRKSFGGLSLLISATLLGLGIYMLVTGDAFATKDTTLVPIIGGTATSVGAVSLLTGLGVVANA